MKRDSSSSRRNAPQSEFQSLRARSASIQIDLDGNHALGCSHNPVGFVSALEELEINAIWVTAEGRNALILSVDALYVGSTIREFAETLFAEELSASQIFFGASHTHNAPNLDASKPSLMAYSPVFIEETKRALIGLRKTLLQQEWRSVTVEESVHSFPGAVLRRKMAHNLNTLFRPNKSKVLMLPNPSETPQLEAKLIQFRAEGKVLSAIYVSPCHPVGYPYPNVISPDYVGHLRETFRASPQVDRHKSPFAFFQGAAGDIRPLALSTEQPDSLRAWVFKILNGAAFGRFTKVSYEKWCQALTPSFLGALENSKPVETAQDTIRTFRKTIHISKFPFLQSNAERMFSIHILQIGAIQILGVSAEVTHRLGTALQSLLHPSATLVACMDDTFGYFAHPSQVAQGGYEVDGWLKPFGVSDAYDPAAASNWLLDEVQKASGQF